MGLIDEGSEVGEPVTEEVHLNKEVQLVMDQRRRATHRRVMNRRNLTMGFHCGCLQVLTPTWTFPIIAYKQLIDNLCFGNNRENILPLELLSALHVEHLGTPGNWNAGKLKLRQMRCVMVTLE